MSAVLHTILLKSSGLFKVIHLASTNIPNEFNVQFTYSSFIKVYSGFGNESMSIEAYSCNPIFC